MNKWSQNLIGTTDSQEKTFLKSVQYFIDLDLKELTPVG